MIDISRTTLALSTAPDTATQEELKDIDECLKVLYATPAGSQEGDRRLGINIESCLDKPLEVAKALLMAEYIEKTAVYEPRVQVQRVDWLESDAAQGIMIPKVVYKVVSN